MRFRAVTYRAGLAAALASLCLCLPVMSAETPSDQGKTEAVGAGRDEASAADNALRRVVLRAAENFLQERRTHAQFVLLRDTVAEAAEELATDRRTVWTRKEVDEELWYANVQAAVDIDAFAARWDRLARLLEEKGPPKLLVFLRETVDAEVLDRPVIEPRLQRELGKEGFVLVHRTDLEDDPRDALVRGVAAEAPTDALRVARQEGAQLLVLGLAEAAVDEAFGSGGTTQPVRPGAPRLFGYRAKASVRLFRTDRPEALDAYTFQLTGGVARSPGEAARQGLLIASNRLEQELRSAALTHWPAALGTPAARRAPAAETEPATQPGE